MILADKSERMAFMKKFFVCTGAVLSYWLLIFLGPVLVLFINNIGYYVTGAGWGPNSIMYSVLRFCSQPIACFMAYVAMKMILKEAHKVLALVNCIIAACMCTLFAFTASRNAQMWTMIVSVAACAYSGVMASKDIREENSEQKTT